jgi:hypothetical protein
MSNKILTILLFSIMIASSVFQTWNMNEEIKELRQTISENSYYRSVDEIKSSYMENKRTAWLAHNSLNDSLIVKYTFKKNPVKKQNKNLTLEFSGSLKSKLSKELDLVYGELVVKDSAGLRILILPNKTSIRNRRIKAYSGRGNISLDSKLEFGFI